MGNQNWYVNVCLVQLIHYRDTHVKYAGGAT